MVKIIKSSTTIEAEGNKPKLIEEMIGHVNSGDSKISIAKMKSPKGWEEPGQTPEFEEYTFILEGVLRVETQDGTYDIQKGEIVVSKPGEWVKYSSPYVGGAEYLAICIPAFSPDTVHRDQ